MPFSFVKQFQFLFQEKGHMVIRVTVTSLQDTNQGRHSTGTVPAQFDPNIAARNLLYIKCLGIKAARAAMFYRS